jgi:uncharacterized protein YdeI (YjbR/CyaY-like superfamily)
MGKRDDRVDAYIAKSADFAKPILHHLRQLVHSGCPDVEETIKWGFPNFVYHGLLCNMASFKQHCSFGFWKTTRISDSRNLLSKIGKTALGNFGQLRSLTDLPPDKIIIAFVQQAAELNAQGVKVPSRNKGTEKKVLKVPKYFKDALSKDSRALKTFKSFSYTNKKEYVDWLTEAKTEETRNKRLVNSIQWLSQGKIRNWKYLKK